MTQPANSEACSLCSHNFGQHYETYDSKKTGCSYAHDDQRDGYWSCECKGFAKIQTYKRVPVIPSYYDWRDH